jgi:AcrR family transcriptional regulator
MGVSMTVKMKTAEKESRPINRDMIRASALALFRDRGVDDTSVNDIVQKAGIAKGTFYLYYSSRDDLINAVFEEFASEFLGEVIEANKDLQKIAPFAESVLNYFRKNRMFLIEVRKNLTQHSDFPYYRRTMSALSGIIGHFLNVFEEYPITQLDTYSEILIGTIIEICYRLFIDKSIKSQTEARIMLEDFMKRFFNCEDGFFLAKK